VVDFETNVKKITINGKLLEIKSDTIEALLSELQIPPSGAAVALNSEIIPLTKHSKQILKDGDLVEIIRPIGGG